MKSNQTDSKRSGNVMRNSESPKSMTMTPLEAVALVENLYKKVRQSVDYLSSLDSNINRFDRISNQEMHMVNKMYRFLKSATEEIKENSDKGKMKQIQDVFRCLNYTIFLFKITIYLNIQ